MDSTEKLYKLPGSKSLIVLSEEVSRGLHECIPSSGCLVRHKSVRFPNEDSLRVIEVVDWFFRYSVLFVKQLSGVNSKMKFIEIMYCKS